jgi:hypothetical protein
MDGASSWDNPYEWFEVKRINTKKSIRPTCSRKRRLYPRYCIVCPPSAGRNRSESSVIRPGRSPQFRELSDEPSPFVDIELHQAFVSHFQQEGLASFLVHDIGAFHNLVDFERFLAERAQDIFSIIQHD